VEDNNNNNRIDNINITGVAGGLHSDNAPSNQPEHTQRFVLNALKEAYQQGVNTLGNENSNEILDTNKVPLTDDDVLLGKVYVTDSNFLLFYVSFEDGVRVSKISLFDTIREELKLLVNDKTSPVEEKLNFSEYHQIQGVFRLRRGCERTVYFVDNYNVPRQYCIDKDYNYIENGYIAASRFNLIKSYKQIPVFERDKQYVIYDSDGAGHRKNRFGIEVQNGGQLVAGSYSVTIRLLDSDFNATDWITTTNTVIIYNEDPADTNYLRVRGSTSIQNDYQQFPPTDKSIKISVRSDSLDNDFLFYQLGLICSNTGSGSVNKVLLSPPLPMETDPDKAKPEFYTYSFTGNIAYEEITPEEVLLNTNIIESAKTIADIDNRLVMGNTKGKQVDWCKLQKYASKITAVCRTRYVALDKLSDFNNTASPLLHTDETGYMPGEIYSFGIVYVFDDGSQSPVYHIPGGSGFSQKGKDYMDYEKTHYPGTDRIYPMDYENNVCENLTYSENNPCSKESYWGRDSQGYNLTGQKVRHHRFPTRRTLGFDLTVQHFKEGTEKMGDYWWDLEEKRKDPSLPDKPQYQGCKESTAKTYSIIIKSKRRGNLGKIAPKFKKLNPTFTIKIYLRYLNPDVLNLTGTISDYLYDVLEEEISCAEWESSAKAIDFKYNGEYGWYRINIGYYPTEPEVCFILEEPVQFLKSTGDKGERYGWMTSAGWIKCKYKTENNEWENDDSNTTHPNEDGSDLSDFFGDRRNAGTNNNLSHTKGTLRPRWKSLLSLPGIITNPANSTDTEGYSVHYLWSNPDNPGNFYYHVTPLQTIGSDVGYFNVSIVNCYDNRIYVGQSIENITKSLIQVIENLDFDIECTEQKVMSQMLGIEFLNVQMPTLKDTNNKKIIGCYIVRNERDEENKTVLDSAIMLPLFQDKGTPNYKNAAYGLTNPTRSDIVDGKPISWDEVKNTVTLEPFKQGVAFINPEFKFLNKKYKNFEFVSECRQNSRDWDYFIPGIKGTSEVSSLDIYDSLISTLLFPRNGKNGLTSKETTWITEDVQSGTSYDKKQNVKKEQDLDGFEMYNVIRERVINGCSKNEADRLNPYHEGNCKAKDNGVDFITFKPDKVEYLAPLENTECNFTEGQRKGTLPIYNLSSDNATGFMFMEKEEVYYEDGGDKYTNKWFPDNHGGLIYGIMKRDLSDPYGLFRILPYYKESRNMIPAQNGWYADYSDDLKTFNGDVYISPMKYFNSLFYDTRLKKRKRKTGLWQVIAGATGAVVGVVGGIVGGIFSGGALAAVGFSAAAASISLMLSGIKIMNANKIYNKLFKAGLKSTFEDAWTKCYLKRYEPSDDQIQWVHEILNSLWFESTINMYWRETTTGTTSSFLDPVYPYNLNTYQDYVLDKMTVSDLQKKDGRLYLGFAKSEFYRVNKDYMRRNKEKIFYHLPIEYDCCSKCLEIFPHRIVYSEQSFQEERTDNYRKFLPNNYRDVPGEAGEVTNMFIWKQNLYIHTKEGLWVLPRNYQERVTGEITSFVGTGDFFSLPPTKIIDDSTGLMSGSKAQWATVVTKEGVFFVDEVGRKIVRLNEQGLIPISDIGESKWFEKNLPIKQNENHRFLYDEEFEFQDLPSNQIGNGFISTYDKKNNRVLFTKIDKVYYFSEQQFDYFTSKGQVYRKYDGSEEYIQNLLADKNALLQPGESAWEFWKTDVENAEIVLVKEETEVTTVPNYVIVPARPAKIFIKGLYVKFEFIDSHLQNTENEPDWTNKLGMQDLIDLGFVFDPYYTIKWDVAKADGTTSGYQMPKVLTEGEILLDSGRINSKYIITLTNLSEIGEMIFGEKFRGISVIERDRDTEKKCEKEKVFFVTFDVQSFEEVFEERTIKICKRWYSYSEQLIEYQVENPEYEEPDEGEVNPEPEFITKYTHFQEITNLQELNSLADDYTVQLDVYRGGVSMDGITLPVREEGNDNAIWCQEITISDNAVLEEITVRETIIENVTEEPAYGFYTTIERVHSEEDDVPDTIYVDNKPKYCHEGGGTPGTYTPFFNVMVNKIYSCGESGPMIESSIGVGLKITCGNDTYHLTPPEGLEIPVVPNKPDSKIGGAMFGMTFDKDQIDAIDEDLWDKINHLSDPDSECSIEVEELQSSNEKCVLDVTQSIVTLNAQMAQYGISLSPLTFSFMLYNECDCTEMCVVEVKKTIEGEDDVNVAKGYLSNDPTIMIGGEVYHITDYTAVHETVGGKDVVEIGFEVEVPCGSAGGNIEEHLFKTNAPYEFDSFSWMENNEVLNIVNKKEEDDPDPDPDPNCNLQIIKYIYGCPENSQEIYDNMEDAPKISYKGMTIELNLESPGIVTDGDKATISFNTVKVPCSLLDNLGTNSIDITGEIVENIFREGSSYALNQVTGIRTSTGYQISIRNDFTGSEYCEVNFRKSVSLREGLQVTEEFLRLLFGPDNTRFGIAKPDGHVYTFNTGILEFTRNEERYRTSKKILVPCELLTTEMMNNFIEEHINQGATVPVTITSVSFSQDGEGYTITVENRIDDIPKDFPMTMGTMSTMSTMGIGIQSEPPEEECDMGSELDVIQDGEKEVSATQIEYERVPILPVGYSMVDNGWTMSFHLVSNQWVSWHSYLPNFYIHNNATFYSFKHGLEGLWKHNIPGKYGSFYGKVYPFIVDFVMLSHKGVITSTWEYLNFIVEVMKYDLSTDEYYDVNTEFFNRMIAYNSRQCSGELKLKVKDSNLGANYLNEQIQGTDPSTITVDRNERNWSLNELRDHRVNYNTPMFISDIGQIQGEYFIDKILNNSSVDFNKNWMEKENFRDKYLELRLFFDNFVEELNAEGIIVRNPKDLKVLINFILDMEKRSFR
jgi:hypothetical protein